MTDIVVVEDGIPRLRHKRNGGSAFTEAISEQLGFSLEEAEIKIQIGLPSIDGTPVSGIDPKLQYAVGKHAEQEMARFVARLKISRLLSSTAKS
jgi:cell division ATPase FtsA